SQGIERTSPHPGPPERLKRSPGTKAPLAWADGPGTRGEGRGGQARPAGSPPPASLYVAAGLAALDRPAGARDQARPVGGEERHHGGDFLGLPKAAQWQIGPGEGGDPIRVGLLPAFPAAAGEHQRARRDAVDQDVVLGQLTGQRLRQADLSRLGLAIAGPTAAFAAIHRGDENDPAASLAAHEGDRRARRAKAGQDIDLQALRILDIGCLEPGAATAARVMDQDVETAE